MTLYFISFLAGILTILAPCVLPILPVILLGSLSKKQRREPYLIIVSCLLSIILFTLLLKVSTVFIALDQKYLMILSGFFVLIYGLSLLFPETWTGCMNMLIPKQKSSTSLQSSGFLKDILLGISLGPMFTTCSPTYALILSVIFPISIPDAMLALLFYVLGFGLMLSLIARGGRSITKRLSMFANPKSIFKKVLGVILVILGFFIMSGFIKKVESRAINQGRYGPLSFEQGLLDKNILDIYPSHTMNTPNTTTSQFRDYDFNNLPTTGDIVLFFHARRCPSCLQAEKNFSESEFPEGLTILKVDFDTARDLKIKYGILTQSSYVLIKPNGEMIHKRIGARDIADVLQHIEEAKSSLSSLGEGVGGVENTTSSGQLATAYFAGGCFWCMEGPFEAMEGVKEVINGYAGGSKETANYDKVSMGTTKHREAVQVVYDPSRVSYAQLLKTYFSQIDPSDAGGQFADRGYQYTTAIFYENSQQQGEAELAKQQLAKKLEKEIAVKVIPFESFYPAEDYHQDYYKKHADHYARYKKGSGRADFIRENQKSIEGALEEMIKQEKIPLTRSQKKRKTMTIDQLSDNQKYILFEGGTEPPFDNAYWNNHKQGIYVDVLDGTPLFSSTDKFDSGTGWPSFTRPIKESMLSEHIDNKLWMKRTEVKSSTSSIHLGHVFNDGPVEKGGQRYCINSAALRFVPLEEMEDEGYGEYVALFGGK